MSEVLLPNRFALIAEVEEDWTTPVDTGMEAIGGTVFRRALSDIEDTVDDEDVAAIRADIAQLKAEHAQARADRKAQLQEKNSRQRPRPRRPVRRLETPRNIIRTGGGREDLPPATGGH
jgi:hypothetical protein